MLPHDQGWAENIAQEKKKMEAAEEGSIGKLVGAIAFFFLFLIVMFAPGS